MLSRRKFLHAGSAAAAGALAAPYIIKVASATEADHVLTFGHTFGKANEGVMITGLNFFKKKAEEYSDGKLKVDIHEAGSLGGQGVLPQKVLTGAIQGCQISTQNFAPFSDAYNLLDFPYMFPTNDSFEEVLSSTVFANSAFFTQPREKGFEVLPGMWANAGYRVLGVSKIADRVVTRPEDLIGLKLRVTGSKVEQHLFGLTPASPVSIAWGETYQALQQGAADALNVGLGPLTATKIFETLGSATMTQINLNCHVTVMNQKWFSKLPTIVQEAITKAGAESFEFQKTEQAKANDAMVEQWQASGINIHRLDDAERKAWNDTIGHTLPVWDDLKDRYDRDLYEKLVALAS